MRCMRQCAILFALWIPAALSIAAQSSQRCPASDPVSSATARYLQPLVVHEGVPRAAALEEFYRTCDFVPAWTRNGVTTPQARALIVEFSAARSKGLDPADYRVPSWEARVCTPDVVCDETPAELARFDIDLTTAAVRYVSDLIYGRVPPSDPRAGYRAVPNLQSIALIVQEKLSNAADLRSAVQELEPQAPGYLRTERALQTWSVRAASATDVAVTPTKSALHPGDVYSQTTALAQRLIQLGDLSSEEASTISSTYEGSLVTAVRRFQTEHGLATTGVVDREVWKALAVPISQRAEQLALTLERWRWAPHTFAEPPIVVNIPEFRVRVYDEQLRVVMNMAVIVGGSAGRHSPILQAQMTEVIFHPFWNVPKKIQLREIAPHLARNPDFLAAHDFQMVNAQGSVVHLSGAAALHAVSGGTVRVRQLPGAQNALGAIKFVFPNAFDVYMHGTPEQRLFQNARRDYSHGCIRVEDPKALAAWALRHESGWTAERIAAAVDDPKSQTLHLSRPIPVLIVYGTGFAAEDGTVRFLNDIYGYDTALRSELRRLSAERRAMDQTAW